MSMRDVNTAFNNAVDTITQVATVGTVSYRPDRGFAPGMVTEGAVNLIDEGIGEMTGRNMAREQYRLQEARRQEALASEQELRAAERKQRQVEDTQASNLARSLRASSRGAGGGSLAPQSLTTDFLGL